MVVTAGQAYITPAARAAVEAERVRLEARLLEVSSRRTYDSERASDPHDSGDLLPIVTPLEGIYQLLQNAVVIDPVDDGSMPAAVGTRVTLRDELGELEEFTLTTPPWTDVRKGRVSWDSPVGRAVMGKRVGDSVQVAAPGGSWQATIVEIVEA